MFYSYKNLPVKINNKQILCSDVTINLANDIQPVYRVGDRSTNDYFPGGNSVGNCELSYYLTGVDHIKGYISDDDTFISGNVGGFYFTSGKLRNYSVDCSPNEPVNVRSSIVFFDQLKGSVGGVNPVTENYPSLNFGDVTIDSLSTYTVDPISNITSLSFNYSAEIQPVYQIDENLGQTSVLPTKVLVNEKTITTEINSDNILPQLSIYGEKAGLKINFTHPNLPSLSENLTCSGFLSQKTFKSSAGEILNTQLSVVQHHTNTPPFIESFTPTTASAGTIITVLGKNLSSVIEAYTYSDNNLYKVAGLNAPDDNTLTFSVTPDNRTGPIILRSLWGSTQSSTSLTVNYSTLDVRDTNISASRPGELVYIYGSNMNQVTHVSFGGTIANYYSHLGGTGILVQIPTEAFSGPVVVGSRTTLQTGTLAYNFIVPPSITGFTPTSGIYGDFITISGKNFTGVTSVVLNTLPINFSLINSIKITGTIPSGWTRGPITVSGVSGFNVTSSGIFEPILKITGISPGSGVTFTALRISGQNFDTGIMYPFSSGGWQVGFNGITTGFQRVNNILLTGTVPSGDVTGPIVVYRKDGTSFPSDFRWARNYTPYAFANNPTGIFSGQFLNMRVSGESLFSLDRVLLTGTGPNSSGNTITILPPNLRSDNQGFYATITGFSLVGHKTGKYDLVAVNSMGSGNLTGALTIFGQINRAREFYVRAYQSTTGTTGTPYPFVYRAEYAIDGDTANSGAIALTNYEASGWWEVKLLKTYLISSVKIYPYATGTIPFLTNFSGIIYDANHTSVYTVNVASPTVPSHNLAIPTGISGKYFRIAKIGSGFVGVGEVEVY